jgi:hypothetical protein
MRAIEVRAGLAGRFVGGKQRPALEAEGHAAQADAASALAAKHRIGHR